MKIRKDMVDICYMLISWPHITQISPVFWTWQLVATGSMVLHFPREAFFSCSMVDFLWGVVIRKCVLHRNFHLGIFVAISGGWGRNSQFLRIPRTLQWKGLFEPVWRRGRVLKIASFEGPMILREPKNSSFFCAKKRASPFWLVRWWGIAMPLVPWHHATPRSWFLQSSPETASLQGSWLFSHRKMSSIIDMFLHGFWKMGE